MVAYPADTPWIPPDDAFLAANYDPAVAAAGSQVVAGTLYLMRLNPRQGITVTNLWFGLSISASGTSTGTFVGLYSSAGVLLSGSADMAGASGFGTGKEAAKCALTTPQVVGAGSVVYAAMLINVGTTLPTIYRAIGDQAFAAFSDYLPAAGLRFAVNGTSLTALPATLTMANNTPTGARTWWVGVT